MRVTRSIARQCASPLVRSAVLLACIAAGAILGGMLALPEWKIAVTAVAATAGAILAVGYPHLGGAAFVAGLVVVTDVKRSGHPSLWPLRDVDVVEGLPPALSLFFMLLFGGYMFRRYLVERRCSSLPMFYLAAYAALMVMSYVVGLQRGTNPVTRRVDFMNHLFPAVLFYLSVNLFERYEHIHAAVWACFAAATVHAAVLCAFFLAGRGVSFVLVGNAPASPIVTLDSCALMAFTAMSLLGCAWIMCGRAGTVSSLAILLCVAPMVFGVVFSFRRGEWLGMSGAFAFLFMLATTRERGRLARLAGPMALALFAGLLLVGVGTQYADSLFDSLSARTSTFTDTEHRSNLYHIAEPLQAIRDTMRSPFLGLGLGGQHGPVPGFDHANVPSHVVHNTWVYLWMKLGTFGLLFLAAVAVTYVKWVLTHLPRADTTSRGRPILMALASLMPLWFVQSMVGPMPWYPHQTFLVAVFSALTVNLIRLEQRERYEQKGAEP